MLPLTVRSIPHIPQQEKAFFTYPRGENFSLPHNSLASCHCPKISINSPSQLPPSPIKASPSPLFSSLPVNCNSFAIAEKVHFATQIAGSFLKVSNIHIVYLSITTSSIPISPFAMLCGPANVK